MRLAAAISGMCSRMDHRQPTNDIASTALRLSLNPLHRAEDHRVKEARKDELLALDASGGHLGSAFDDLEDLRNDLPPCINSDKSQQIDEIT